MTPSELQSKMLLWRQQCIDGTITQEDLTTAMAALRGTRQAAAVATTAKKAAKAKAVIPSADDMLSELGIDNGDEPEKDDE